MLSGYFHERARDQARGRYGSANVGRVERALSFVAGSALAMVGLRRRGASGMAIALAGAELARRGITGHCRVYDALGVSTHTGAIAPLRGDVTGRAATVNARKAIKVERAVHVDRPALELYRIWRDFSNLPRFMKHIDSVACTDDLHSHWVAHLPGGAHAEWDSEIVNDVEGKLIAWKTVGDPDVAHAGSVHFTPLASGSTEVRIVFDYEPPFARTIGRMVTHLGATPETLVDGDLQRFKGYVESSPEYARPVGD